MMKAPASKIYSGPEQALALVLSLAVPECRELFLQALRARFTLTEPCRDRHPTLSPPIP